MSKLKLEVGKKYRDRHGRVVKIIRNGGTQRYPFQSDNYIWYSPDGRTTLVSGTELDLIEEVRPEPKRRKVKWPIRGRVKRKESAEAIYYTPGEVEMIIGNPTYAYPEAEESFGPEAPELTFTQAEYSAALRLAGIDTTRPYLFYRIAALMQETTGNPTLSQVMGVWENDHA